MRYQNLLDLKYLPQRELVFIIFLLTFEMQDEVELSVLQVFQRSLYNELLFLKMLLLHVQKSIPFGHLITPLLIYLCFIILNNLFIFLELYALQTFLEFEFQA